MPDPWTTWAKPAGIPVFPPHADPAGPCVLAQVLRAHPERAAVSWLPGFEGGICHRLDTHTSGALLLADSPEALDEARRQFAERRIAKRYLLLAARDPGWSENTCDRAIAHDPRRKSRMVVQRGESTPHRGRWYPASTRFVRVRGLLFRAEMATGVTHQIRAHAAFLGMPLAGDPIYGGGRGGFCLHHEGLAGEGGLRTEPVPLPAWAQISRM